MENEKQIEEMAKSKKCNTCVHNAVCQELEEFRDPLGWISTEGEFVCSYYDAGYRKASDIAREIFEEIEKISEDSIHQEISEEYGFVLSERYDGKKFNKNLTKFRKECENKYN